MGYTIPNFIGQFVTILSVNKTRDFGKALSRLALAERYAEIPLDGRFALIFLLWARTAPILFFKEI